MVSRIIGQLMNFDDGGTFFNWAKLHKSKSIDKDAARIPYPSLMDYGSVKDGAYNTKLALDSNYQNDLQDIEPKAYQKSELPAKTGRISLKNKKMK